LFWFCAGYGSTITLESIDTNWIYSAPEGFVSNSTAHMPAVALSSPQTGSFTGNANADGRFVYLGFRPDVSSGSSTINGNTITWGTHADATATGFKLRTASASYNASGSNTYSIVVDQVTQGGSKKSSQARAA
jgi:hypothetical protein